MSSKWWTPDHDLVLIHGENLEVMATFKDDQADAIVTDPPYFLGFMGASWDSSKKISYYEFSLAWAREAFRILKPGGHLVAFSSTRTYHRMASAIEDVGFEIRDCLEWIYGSGYPKSRDISKDIDKLAGAEREVIRTDKNWGASTLEEGKSAFGDYAGEWDVTAPATEEAQLWQGWGTGLKPAHEPIAFARKPLAEKTVVKNVLAHGTGAIHVDGCRVGSDGGYRTLPGASCNRSPTVAAYGEGLNGVAAVPVEGMGRWPPNVVLTHSPQCEQVGTRKIKGNTGTSGGVPDSGIYGKSMPRGSGEPTGWYTDEDGTETMAAWNCAEGCPVAEMEQQKDGSSRFFPVFSYDENDFQFLYHAKAPPKDRPTVNGKKHSTVKPVPLMQWLVRLVCPGGGVVLDMHAGTGTTGQAALREGCKAILIEQSDTDEHPYVRMARKRLGL